MKNAIEEEHIMQYHDIINLPHHQSAKRPHMSIHDRAAQFASFAALTGHKEAIRETEIRKNREGVENEYEAYEEEFNKYEINEYEDI